ncbi:MAG TPA: DUF4399 domain-containing protein [Puia sp.]|nr:DUF4399 domain-containing protein [Puia sp.]
MRKLYFLPAALLLGLAACNNAGDQTAASGDTTKKANDTMNMNHTMSDSPSVTPVPAIPAGAKVYFKNLKDGETVKSPLKVEMGVDGMTVDSVSKKIIASGSGHHHLFIDAEDSLASGTVVPKDSTHLHFGNAQTSAEIKLTPGEHKLTLQYADGIHRSYGAKLATTIKVKVK